MERQTVGGRGVGRLSIQQLRPSLAKQKDMVPLPPSMRLLMPASHPHLPFAMRRQLRKWHDVMRDKVGNS